jgi:hypothetical protein
VAVAPPNVRAASQPADGQALVFDEASGLYVPADLPEGESNAGIDEDGDPYIDDDPDLLPGAFDDLDAPVIKHAVISATTSGPTTVVPAVNGKKICPVAYTIVTGAAVIVKWKSDTADLPGGAKLDANGGLAIGAEFVNPLFRTVNGDALILNLVPASTSVVSVGGHLSYYEE